MAITPSYLGGAAGRAKRLKFSQTRAAASQAARQVRLAAQPAAVATPAGAGMTPGAYAYQTGATAMAGLEQQRVAAYSQAGQRAIGGPLTGGGYTMSAAGRGVNQDFARRRIALGESIYGRNLQTQQANRQYGLAQQQFGLQERQLGMQQDFQNQQMQMEHARLVAAKNASRRYSRGGSSRTGGGFRTVSRPSYAMAGSFGSLMGNRAFQRINA
jgi:hypothetical protein